MYAFLYLGVFGGEELEIYLSFLKFLGLGGRKAKNFSILPKLSKMYAFLYLGVFGGEELENDLVF